MIRLTKGMSFEVSVQTISHNAAAMPIIINSKAIGPNHPISNIGIP